MVDGKLSVLVHWSTYSVTSDRAKARNPTHLAIPIGLVVAPSSAMQTVEG